MLGFAGSPQPTDMFTKTHRETAMIKRPSIRAQSAPWRNGVEIKVSDEDGKGVGTLVYKKTSPIEKTEPTTTIDIDAAQTLMDDLWNAGLRPTEGTGSAGALRSTHNHLEDMRKIAFHTLNIDR